MAQSFGQSHVSYSPDIPVYGTICRSGKEWTVTLQTKVTSTGCTITGSASGYGPFPREKYPDIPVIDFTGETFDRCFEAMLIHDYLNPKDVARDLVPFIQAHKDKGFKVI
jgi:hypothetical protein